MIFVTVGTHRIMGFDRLVRKMDNVSKNLNEKVIIQRGCTDYLPKNCESFTWTDSLEKYYADSRIIIMHGASSVWEFALKNRKPLIIVPRLYKYKEHYNDHQLEFAEYFSKKTGVACITDVNKITPEFLKNYNKIAHIDPQNMKNLKHFLKDKIKRFNQKISN